MTAPAPLGPDLFVFDAEQRFLGLELGARMTVLRVDGDLLLHSPVALDPAHLERLGRPRWLLAPNTFHHLHAGPWLARGLTGYAAPGLVEKRRDLDFAQTIDAPCAPFGDAVQLIPLQSLPLVGEVALLHRPSRTLVVTDLVFNLGDDAPWATRVAFRLLGGTPGCRATLLERALMRRAVARDDLRGLLALDFDRLIMAHGHVIETGGKAALRGAYSWLGDL